MTNATKVINSAMHAGCFLGTLELVAMGRKAGLALDCMTEVLNKGGGRNETTVKVLPSIAGAQRASSANTSLTETLEDLNRISSLGMQFGVPMPVTAVVRGVLQAGSNMIGPQASLNDMIGVVESMAGTRLASTTAAASPRRLPESEADAASLKVGFVGLGVMGGALARRLMLSRDLGVFDADPAVAAQFEIEGAQRMHELPELAKWADVILLCLPTSAVVRSVLFGAGGIAEGLSAGKIVVDQTSGDPAETRRLAAELQALGVNLIDAPVSGGPNGAAAGTIAVMAGGPLGVFERVRPVLASMSPNIVYCGEIGNGHAVKLVNNGVSSLCRLVTYECVALGVKSGLSLTAMSKSINSSTGWSVPSQKVLPAVAAGKEAANFQLQLMAKDLRLAAGLGQQCGAPMLVSNAVRTLFEAASNIYGGVANIDDMARLYGAMAAMEFSHRKAA